MSDDHARRTSQVKDFAKNLIGVWRTILSALVKPIKLFAVAMAMVFGFIIYLLIPMFAYTFAVHGTTAPPESALGPADEVMMTVLALVWVIIGVSVVVAADKTWELGIV